MTWSAPSSHDSPDRPDGDTNGEILRPANGLSIIVSAFCALKTHVNRIRWMCVCCILFDRPPVGHGRGADRWPRQRVAGSSLFPPLRLAGGKVSDGSCFMFHRPTSATAVRNLTGIDNRPEPPPPGFAASKQLAVHTRPTRWQETSVNGRPIG